jgi:hypothetical protein
LRPTTHAGKETRTTNANSRPRFFGALIYATFASLSYIFVFDKATFQHPKYLKNQIRMEIKQTLDAIPIMATASSTTPPPTPDSPTLS